MRDYANCLPALLDLDLCASGWNGAINPYPGMSLKQKAMQSLRSAFLKKFQDCVTKAADANALALFTSINEKCRSFNLDTSRCTEAQALVIGEAKDFLYRLFFPDDQTSVNNMRLTLSEICDNFGVGNGANIGSFSTDFLSKVGTSTMATTDRRLFLLYKQAISRDPLWSSVESTRSKFRETEIVRGSRLSFVPKTTEISRTICTEPLLNMLYQKGIAKILEDILKERCGISLSEQPDKNRWLAWLGSKRGRFGTIDLSSASDSMSLSLVDSMFPKHVSSLLRMCRSPFTILPDGTEVELHMISSMGNAFTFPLQTMLFTALVYGVYRVLSIPFERPFRRFVGSFAVFGDDIICESKAYNLLVQVLSLCGFSVNVDKSFNEGLFRESCGHDYYCGRNVRGVYIKTLKTDHDKYSAINRLNRWSAIWGIPLPNVISYLLKGLRFIEVPMDEMDDAGIKVPESMLRKRVLSKYTGGLRYRYLYSRGREYSVTDVEARPPKVRGWVFNPDAVLLAAIAGTLRAGKLVVRSPERKRSGLRTRYSSSWDYIPFDYADLRRVGEGWKFLFELNLTFNKI